MLDAPTNNVIISRSCNTSTFNGMRFNENPFTCQCKKEDKKSEGFQILHFYWSFSSDIMAVKGLMCLDFVSKR